MFLFIKDLRKSMIKQLFPGERILIPAHYCTYLLLKLGSTDMARSREKLRKMNENKEHSNRTFNRFQLSYIRDMTIRNRIMFEKDVDCDRSDILEWILLLNNQPMSNKYLLTNASRHLWIGGVIIRDESSTDKIDPAFDEFLKKYYR